jgi:hypothetical protein
LRAIRGLLSPETLKNARPAEITSRWTDGEADVALSYEDGRIKASPEDHPLARLPLPPHLAHCTTVTLEDLQPNLRAHEALTDEIARQMAGGFDWMKLSGPALLKRIHSVAEPKSVARRAAETLALQQARPTFGAKKQLVDLEERNGAATRQARVDVGASRSSCRMICGTVRGLEQILRKFRRDGNMSETKRAFAANPRRSAGRNGKSPDLAKNQHEAAAREETTAAYRTVADEILEKHRLASMNSGKGRLLDEKTAQSAGGRENRGSPARSQLVGRPAIRTPSIAHGSVDFEALFHEAKCQRAANRRVGRKN